MFAFIWIFTVTCVWWCEVYKRLIAKRWHQLCWAYSGMIQKLVKSFSILFTPSNNITLELLNCALFTCLYEQHTVQLHLQFECKNQRSTNMLLFFSFTWDLFIFFGKKRLNLFIYQNLCSINALFSNCKKHNKLSAKLDEFLELLFHQSSM